MHIIPFPPKPRVVISSGLVSETRVKGDDAIKIVRHNPPLKIFFLDLCEEGGTAGVWDGHSYEAALAAAAEWQADGVEICDLTGETRGGA